MILRRRHRMFIQAYVADPELNGARAARAVGCEGESARKQASKWLNTPTIKAEVDRLLAAKAAAAGISADKVLQEWVDIANADITDFMITRRAPCRYCHGIGHDYQYRHSEWIDLQRTGSRRKKLDPRGGIGYDPHQDPNEECPECFGEGEPYMIVEDLNALPPAKRRLITLVRQGNNGIELKLKDADKAQDSIAKHLGMFTEKLDINVKVGLADRLARARRRVTANEQ